MVFAVCGRNGGFECKMVELAERFEALARRFRWFEPVEEEEAGEGVDECDRLEDDLQSMSLDPDDDDPDHDANEPATIAKAVDPATPSQKPKYTPVPPVPWLKKRQIEGRGGLKPWQIDSSRSSTIRSLGVISALPA